MGRNGSTCLPLKIGNNWNEHHSHQNGPYLNPPLSDSFLLGILQNNIVQYIVFPLRPSPIMVTFHQFSSTVRYCKFLHFFLDPLISYRFSAPVGFDKQVVVTEDIHTEPHAYKHKYAIPSKTWNICSQASADENIGFNWQKLFDWANFYIYVLVYISTTLWPWVNCSSAELDYSPH